MLLGRVRGSVVSTRKDPKLEGLTLLVLETLQATGKPTNQFLVAIDSVGAGEGEVVLYASGSSARQTTVTQNRPCDAVIMAIVDQWDLNGKTVYDKSVEG